MAGEKTEKRVAGSPPTPLTIIPIDEENESVDDAASSPDSPRGAISSAADSSTRARKSRRRRSRSGSKRNSRSRSRGKSPSEIVIEVEEEVIHTSSTSLGPLKRQKRKTRKRRLSWSGDPDDVGGLKRMLEREGVIDSNAAYAASSSSSPRPEFEAPTTVVHLTNNGYQQIDTDSDDDEDVDGPHYNIVPFLRVVGFFTGFIALSGNVVFGDQAEKGMKYFFDTIRGFGGTISQDAYDALVDNGAISAFIANMALAGVNGWDAGISSNLTSEWWEDKRHNKKVLAFYVTNTVIAVVSAVLNALYVLKDEADKSFAWKWYMAFAAFVGTAAISLLSSTATAAAIWKMIFYNRENTVGTRRMKKLAQDLAALNQDQFMALIHEADVEIPDGIPQSYRYAIRRLRSMPRGDFIREMKKVADLRGVPSESPEFSKFMLTSNILLYVLFCGFTTLPNALFGFDSSSELIEHWGGPAAAGDVIGGILAPDIYIAKFFLYGYGLSMFIDTLYTLPERARYLKSMHPVKAIGYALITAGIYWVGMSSGGSLGYVTEQTMPDIFGDIVWLIFTFFIMSFLQASFVNLTGVARLPSSAISFVQWVATGLGRCCSLLDRTETLGDKHSGLVSSVARDLSRSHLDDKPEITEPLADFASYDSVDAVTTARVEVRLEALKTTGFFSRGRRPGHLPVRDQEKGPAAAGGGYGAIQEEEDRAPRQSDSWWSW